MTTSSESTSPNQPHARYQHLFVVGRVWRAATVEEGQMKLHDLTLTKAFLTEGEAEREAARLNGINGDQWLYFVRVARLFPEPSD
jgi:hypothetical protein